MDMQEILSKVITSTNEIFKAEAGSVAMIESSGQEIVIRAAVGAGADAVRGLSLPIDKGVIGWVASHERPALIPDVTKDERFYKDIDKQSGFHTKSILCAPMQAGGHTIGVIELMNMHHDYLSDDGLRILSVIADHAALAIENARLHNEATRRLAEAKVLQEVMVAAASSLDFNKVLTGTIEALHRTLGIERLGFFLPASDGKNVISHPATIGFNITNGALPIPMDGSAVGWVIRNGKPALIPNVTEFSQYYELAADTRSELCVPVVLNGQVAAVLNAESPRLNAFDHEDLRLFRAIAAELAVALENAQLYQTEHRLVKQQQALMDVFTDLSMELKPEVLFQRIIERAIEVIPNADVGSLIVPKGEEFVYAAAVGFDIRQLQSVTFAREDFLRHQPGPQKVERLSHLELVDLSRKSFPHTFEQYTKAGRLHEIKCTLRAILHAGDAILGSINVDSLSEPEAFTEEDEQTLLLFASQAAIAIQNARLFEDIRTAEANYRDLFDNANDFIFTLDSNFRISSANKAVLKATGYQLEEIIGTHITEFILPEQTPKLFKLLKARLASDKSPATFELPVRGKGEKKALLEVTIRVRRVGRRPVNIHCIARDITQRRELEKQLRQTEKLSTIGKLVAGVAHELNNPLTSIIGYASLLQENDILQPYRDDLEVIFRQADRARLIVKDLLTFARKIDLETRPVDINEIIQTSLALTKPALQSHQVRVTTALDFGLPLTMADSHQLEQVFVNLITNAVQALATVTRSRYLTIESKRANNVILLRFADNGPGVPAEIAHRIFDPFFSTKQVGEGTGLGLSICFGIISEHQGRIWAEEASPTGATFYVELPIVPVKEVAPLPASSDLAAIMTTPPLTSLQILVIDDELPLLNLLRRVLERQGHNVATASGGKTALEKLNTKAYDLIICDVVMPDILGPEIYRQVVDKFPHLAQHFIFITGNVVDIDTRLFLEKTALPWLAKPFLPADIERAINKALAKMQAPTIRVSSR
jgi:two-component system NtrC family sensor kinase